MGCAERAIACLTLAAVAAVPARVSAQVSRRLPVLLAEERGGQTASDLAIIRAGVRSQDPATARIAVRALGHLHRPALLADIEPALRARAADVRAEAASAIADAVQTSGETQALSLLMSRLRVEDDADVRAVICESIGRVPFKNPDDRSRAETALVASAAANTGLADRLGVAKGLEAMARGASPDHSTGAPAIALLRDLAGIDGIPAGADPARDARTRRLAFGALMAAGVLDENTIRAGLADSDVQVRRLAVDAFWRAGAASDDRLVTGVIEKTIGDESAVVRMETLRASNEMEAANVSVCPLALNMAAGDDMPLALVAIDRLGTCHGFDEAGSRLERMVNDLSDVNQPRGWHRAAHALVALAELEPERTQPKLVQFAASPNPWLRLYAAKAAVALHDRATVARLSLDSNHLVAEAAGNRPKDLERTSSRPELLTAASLQRLAAPKARVTIRDVGAFDVALLTSEAPSTVLRFARLAQSGYYNGLTFGDMSAGLFAETILDDERAADTAGVPSEVGTWPHVRGSVGWSAEGSGRQGMFFIDLVDNPQFDHHATVFGHVLNGFDVIDRTLEGDVIERIDIIP